MHGICHDHDGKVQVKGREHGPDHGKYTMKKCEQFCKNKKRATGCMYGVAFKSCRVYTEPIIEPTSGGEGYFCLVFKKKGQHLFQSSRLNQISSWVKLSLSLDGSANMVKWWIAWPALKITNN